MKHLLTFLFVFLFAATSCTTESKPEYPKNVILLIGDGMGLSQVSSSFYFQESKTNFWRFTNVGLSKTSSYREKITDSAAGATALATGNKTYNGAISVDNDGKPLSIITDLFSEAGKATGVIATSSIVHATPACFFANVTQRRLYEDIATQLPNSSVDFFAGGGLQFFNKRSDGLNYLDTLSAYGFVVDTIGVSSQSPLSASTKYGYLLAPDGMPIARERGEFLPQVTKVALDYLNQNDQGFFLMIEGSQIDWGGHDNNTDYLVEEMIDFDKTIGVVLDFVQQHPETLVIVTADHETGGFSLSSSGDDYDQIKPTFSTGGHSAALVPVFALGKGAELFNGIYENTEIYNKILKAIGAEAKP